MEELNAILEPYANQIQSYYEQEYHPSNPWYPLFYKGQIKQDDKDWVKQNYETFLKGTANEILYNRWYHPDSGYITALEYAPNGSHIIAGYSSGLIQLHHGRTGAALYTLRNAQFPPKPICALEYSRTQEGVCYAACVDGTIYRIDIPFIPDLAVEDRKMYGIKANPGLDCLQMQYYTAPGPSMCSDTFITYRSPALALGISADSANMVVGYGDTSIRVYDMETQQAIRSFKVHKLRLQFIPKKLQRMHFGQVCAVKCHDDRPFVFASAAWDKTVRIWDTRCQVGCMMTFEGVDVCSNSIDLKRNFCIAGSWLPTEALTVWDIVAKKKVSIVRVQNRRPDVDGEYIYACRFWNSSKYNRKAKYGIIGGSGTNCVEIINLHNRYITCSYPAEGAVLAITSHEDHIAFGGTAPVFNIVSFHDPKHEEYPKEEEHNVYQDPGSVVVHDFEDYESRASEKSTEA
ncbi:uncharacterized protein LOC134665503 [Cydia fagiglandana]|uniref:uncharacterized protein LOC134665503 n=1 Tax=Cydia fagiglandana TaxID=1458189 RepID=UPI002FEDFAE7